MARSTTAARQRSPRGKNILISAFDEVLYAQPERWQKLAGLAAVTQIMSKLKAMPDWKDPKEAPTKRGRTKTTRKTASTGSTSTRRTTRKTMSTGSRGRTRRTQEASNSSSELNGASNHADQA